MSPAARYGFTALAGGGLGALIAWLVMRRYHVSETQSLLDSAQQAIDSTADPAVRSAIVDAAADVAEWTPREIAIIAIAGAAVAIIVGAGVASVGAGAAAVIAFGGGTGIAAAIIAAMALRRLDEGNLKALLMKASGGVAPQPPVPVTPPEKKTLDMTMTTGGFAAPLGRSKNLPVVMGKPRSGSTITSSPLPVRFNENR